MKRVLTAVGLIPLVLLAVWKAPPLLFLALTGGVALLCTQEYLNLVKALGHVPLRTATLGFQVGTFVLGGLWYRNLAPGSDFFLIPVVLGLAAPIALCAMFALAMRQSELRTAFASATLSAAALPYLGMPMMALAGIREAHHGLFWTVFLFAVVWVGDIAAFYAGRSFGRRLLAPRISPKKTWLGAAASLGASVVVAALLVKCRWLDPPSADWPIYVPPLLAIPVNIAAQLGDLTESLLKRGAGVKDSGSLLPGHGGILDRVDALLFAAPVLWYFGAFAVVFSY